jgi:hypothetical protein
MMDNFIYIRPATLKDAASQLGKEHGKIAVIAGGTDLLGEMKDNLAAPERLVSIRHLADLQGVRASAGGLRIGAATLLADVVENPMVQEPAARDGRRQDRDAANPQHGHDRRQLVSAPAVLVLPEQVSLLQAWR